MTTRKTADALKTADNLLLAYALQTLNSYRSMNTIFPKWIIKAPPFLQVPDPQYAKATHDKHNVPWRDTVTVNYGRPDIVLS